MRNDGESNYDRIKRDVLAIVRDIPAGKVTTYAAIGAALDVMPRHVAYLLAMLTDLEQDDLPWYRVVGLAGKLSTTNPIRAGKQRAFLEAEGISFRGKWQIDAFDLVFFPIAPAAE
ncbi:MGMT family protein [Tuwongella immobilis]|uniref:MGMT family protein n=1 Tax=Tuwongella immobilis TaxID=692036 RepID=UPI0013A699F1|nr:MGMT family protein [Tuwongella immobilis]